MGRTECGENVDDVGKHFDTNTRKQTDTHEDRHTRNSTNINKQTLIKSIQRQIRILGQANTQR